MNVIGVIIGILFFAAVHAEVRATDYLGDEVVLVEPAVRIIALSPHIVENVFAAGAGDLLVGVVEYSDFPPQAMLLPKVGGFASFNLEAIVSLRPDLIIAWNTGNGRVVVEQLRGLNFPVFVDEPVELSDVAKSIVAIGVLTGRNLAAKRSSEKYLQRLQSLTGTYANKSNVSVLYQVWHSPIQTINRQHIISKVMKSCGGENSFGDALVIAPIINRETVIARNPDVIVASGINGQRPLWLDTWQQWPSLSAVRNNNIYSIPPDIIQRHTPRILQGMEMMCEQLEEVRRTKIGD